MRTLRAANPARSLHNTVKRTSLGGTPLEERLDYGCKGRCDPSTAHFRISKGKDLCGEAHGARAFRANDFNGVLNGDLGTRPVFLKDEPTSKGEIKKKKGGGREKKVGST